MSDLTDILDRYAAGEMDLPELTIVLRAFPWRTPKRLEYKHHTALEAELHGEDTAMAEEPNTWDEVRTARYLKGQLTRSDFLHLTAAIAPVRIAKFSEDQPRDERGRFASTSDGTASGDTVDPAAAGSLQDLMRGPYKDEWKRVTNAITAQGTGNCYEAAGTLAMNAHELGLKNVEVIQATVMGRGSLEGQRFGHSWIEADGPTLPPINGVQFPPFRNVYDWSSNNHVIMPQALYYHLGSVEDIHRYDLDQTMAQMVETEHYGPWAPDTPIAGSSDWENSGPVDPWADRDE
jgi:hypothetical protein